MDDKFKKDFIHILRQEMDDKFKKDLPQIIRQGVDDKFKKDFIHLLREEIDRAVDPLRMDIKSLKLQFGAMADKMDSLQTQINQFRQEVKVAFRVVKEEIRELKDKTYALMAEMEDLRLNVGALKDENVGIKEGQKRYVEDIHLVKQHLGLV